MQIKTLYEDEDFLVIEKPSGVAVHPDGKTREETVTDWVLENYPEMKNVGEPLGDIVRPGVVHRLDKETSGVLVLAKHQKAHQFLKKQFQERTVKKTYHAIVDGILKEDQGIINKLIGRSPKDFRRRLSGRGARGEMREAITEYKVLKRFTDQNGQNFTYLVVTPKTGRTHQIRVHMKFINHPIVGDTLYNPKGVSSSRMMLHAYSMEFRSLDDKLIKVESQLPKILKDFGENHYDISK